MQLYLMQHAKAKPEAEDPEEGLSDAGKQSAEKMGALLSILGVKPKHVLVSPKKRSKETAQFVLAQLDSFPSLKETESIKAKAETIDTLNELQALGDAQSVLVVGHVPSLELLVKYLCGATVVFQNAGCLSLEVEKLEPLQSKILWYLPPNL